MSHQPLHVLALNMQRLDIPEDHLLCGELSVVKTYTVHRYTTFERIEEYFPDNSNSDSSYDDRINISVTLAQV